MSILNQNINFEDIKKTYLERQLIIIKDFLSKDAAESVYQGLKDLSEKRVWYTSQYGRPNIYFNDLQPKESVVYNFAYTHDMFPLKNYTIPMMLKSNMTKPFIEKLSNIYDNPEMELQPNHPLRKISNFLNSKEMHDLMRYITGINITDNDMLAFASRYKSDDFIALHNDGSDQANFPRKIAFVLSMTKNWLVNWGGALMFVNEQENEVLETLMPSFNTLTIFTVPLKHVVLPVSEYCQSERLSITGWYQNINK